MVNFEAILKEEESAIYIRNIKKSDVEEFIRTDAVKLKKQFPKCTIKIVPDKE